MTTERDDLDTDRALVARMRKYLGHIQDMCDDERVFMLGALTGALERHLAEPGAVKDPEAGDFVKVSGRILSIHDGTALVEVYRSYPVGLRVPVQCGALEHVEPVAGGDMPLPAVPRWPGSAAGHEWLNYGDDRDGTDRCGICRQTWAEVTSDVNSPVPADCPGPARP